MIPAPNTCSPKGHAVAIIINPENMTALANATKNLSINRISLFHLISQASRLLLEAFGSGRHRTRDGRSVPSQSARSRKPHIYSIYRLDHGERRFETQDGHTVAVPTPAIHDPVVSCRVYAAHVDPPRFLDPDDNGDESPKTFHEPNPASMSMDFPRRKERAKMIMKGTNIVRATVAYPI